MEPRDGQMGSRSPRGWEKPGKVLWPWAQVTCERGLWKVTRNSLLSSHVPYSQMQNVRHPLRP